LKKRKLTAAEAAAYRAPFPTLDHQTAPLVFPRLEPIRHDHPGAYDHRAAIERLRALDIPVLLPWADGDPITAAGEKQLRGIFRRTAPPLTIKGAGHFLRRMRARRLPP
jgi:haloalkane dehalogenase